MCYSRSLWEPNTHYSSLMVSNGTEKKSMKGTRKSYQRFRSLGDTITDTFTNGKRVAWENSSNEGCLVISSDKISFCSEEKLGAMMLSSFAPTIIACDCDNILPPDRATIWQLVALSKTPSQEYIGQVPIVGRSAMIALRKVIKDLDHWVTQLLTPSLMESVSHGKIAAMKDAWLYLQTKFRSVLKKSWEPWCLVPSRQQ